jgi:Flp pilus assembly protein TadG
MVLRRFLQGRRGSVAPMLAALLHRFRINFPSNKLKILASSVRFPKPQACHKLQLEPASCGAAVMSIRSFFQSRLPAFLKNQRGNVAPIFAIAVIPIIGLTGMAIDYSRANALRTSIQAALDATALALAKSAATLSKQSTPTCENMLQCKADDYFKALVNRPEATIDPIKVTYSSDNATQLVLSASGHVDLTLSNVFSLIGLNFTKIDVGTTSTIKWGNTRLRVALVLDNTGSMLEDDKIGALKKAVAAPPAPPPAPPVPPSLLYQLKDAGTTDKDVFVSIIPFVKDVNANKANYTANWVDWTEWEGEPPILDTANGGAKPNNWYSRGPGSNCPFWSKNSSSHTSNYGFECMDRPATASGAQTTTTIPTTTNYNGLICPSIDGGNKKPLKASDYYNGCYNSWKTCVGSTCACTTSNTSICSCTGSGASKTCNAQGSNYEHTWRPSKSNTYTPALVLDSSTVPYATPAHSTWNGCVVDRGNRNAPDSGNYDANVDAPVAGTTATMFAAEQYASCPPAILPLGSPLDPTAFGNMTTLVNNMNPAGNTNQAIGLMHGWMSLVGGGPYPTPPAKDTNYIYNEVIILLTDGLNTQDRWYTDQASIDTREKLACDKINKANITLYTIQVNTGGDPVSTLLKNCAGSPGVYPDTAKNFVVTTSAGISTVFNQIGKQLSQLRVAQ